MNADDLRIVSCRCGGTPEGRGDGDDYHIVCLNWWVHKNEAVIFGEKSKVIRIWNDKQASNP